MSAVRKPLVYVAGPITGDPFGCVRQSAEAFGTLRALGCVPFCPQWSVIAEMVQHYSYEEWMAYDFDVIARADALVRLPGDSPGADREVVHADDLGIPIFWITTRHSYEVMRAFVERWHERQGGHAMTRRGGRAAAGSGAARVGRHRTTWRTRAPMKENEMGQPALVTRDVLAVLDDAGVRCEVVETDANYTTLRFDHLALDDLAKAVANVDWDDCSAELDRLYAAAEANQAPGPDWKAKLRGEVEALRDYDTESSWRRGRDSAVRQVLALIDALPDPPTPDPLARAKRRLSLPESAEDLRAARDALHAEIGHEAAVRIILGQEEATEPDGDGWSLTERAKIALSWLATTRPSPTPDPDAPPVYVPPEGHVAPVLGRDVPDGWEGRTRPDGLWFSSDVCQVNRNDLFEVRRVPAPEPATEWVPLTKLVGRTLPHGPSCDPNPPVAKVSSGYDGWFWHADADSDVRTTIMGIRGDGCVEVLAEGERS